MKSRILISDLKSSAALSQVRAQLSVPSLTKASEALAGEKPRKYRNKPCTAWGIKFPSKRECDRFGELLLLHRAGKITKPEAHPSWSLDINGVHIGKYTADNTYCEIRGDCLSPQIIEDVKSKPTMTGEAKLRIRVFEAIYKATVRIVT